MTLKIKHLVLLFTCFISCHAFALAQAEKKQLIEQLQGYYSVTEEKLDFAKIKLEIDKIVEPKTNIPITFLKINHIVTTIKKLHRPNATDTEKLSALKKYLYEAGSWNQYRVYQYDFEDPLGKNIKNKLLANYLITRKGNCISMPILFFILADKLELNVSLSTAPLHVFVKYTDEQGKTYNLEPTSGAGITRDIWYQQKMHITNKAIQSGIYLATLSKQESLTVLTSLVAEHYFKQKDFETVLALSSLSLEKYPKYVNVMLRAGSCFYKLLQQEYLSKYPNPNMIPINKRERFQYLSNNNRGLFAHAEKLGWQEPPENIEQQYLNVIKNNKEK
jgi:hypothetical protein